MKTGIYKNVDKVFSGPKGALNTLLKTSDRSKNMKIFKLIISVILSLHSAIIMAESIDEKLNKPATKLDILINYLHQEYLCEGDPRLNRYCLVESKYTQSPTAINLKFRINTVHSEFYDYHQLSEKQKQEKLISAFKSLENNLGINSKALSIEFDRSALPRTLGKIGLLESYYAIDSLVVLSAYTNDGYKLKREGKKITVSFDEPKGF